MLINIITPHVGAFIGIILSGFKRCWDRKCTCDKKKTRRRVQEDYEMLYMGPDFLIEIRYSQIISSFYIIMIYSAGLPFLYLLAMVQTFVLYWVDKFLCKLLPKYNFSSPEALSDPTQVWPGDGRCDASGHDLCDLHTLRLRFLHVFQLVNLHLLPILRLA